MKTELIMGEKYILGRSPDFIYLGIGNSRLEEGSQDSHIFACRIKGHREKSSWVYTIPLDQIKIEGRNVSAKDGNCSRFRQSLYRSTRIAEKSMIKGLEMRISLKTR